MLSSLKKLYYYYTCSNQLSDTNYHFIDASRSSTSTTDEASKFEASSLTGSGSTDGQQCYGCGCGKFSFHSFLEGRCPKPIPGLSSFLYLNTEGLNENQRAILRGRLYDEFEKVDSEFAILVNRTWKSLIQQGVTVKELVRVLVSLDAFQPTKPAKPLLDERIDDLNRCADIDAVVRILRDYISFFSHKIIDNIIHELGTPEDQERLQKYTAKLDEYSKRCIF